MTCCVDGCTKPVRCRGWCVIHYNRWWQQQKVVIPCSIIGCTKPSKGRGLCAMHYWRWCHHGDPLWTPPVKTELERFLAKVNKHGAVPSYAPHLGRCWIWKGAQSAVGYGKFRSNESNNDSPHRWAYKHFVGPIPEGLEIDHLCRVQACANPKHLEAVTPRTNTLRGATLPAANVIKTHCPWGHPYDTTNTYFGKKGNRQCRACAARRARERYHADAGMEAVS